MNAFNFPLGQIFVVFILVMQNKCLGFISSMLIISHGIVVTCGPRGPWLKSRLGANIQSSTAQGLT